MFNIRFIETKKQVRYLRQEDVYEYLVELASSEETDVRERIEAAARILNSVGVYNGFKEESI